jgi:hypothetical protein
VNALAGDLHLAATTATAIDRGSAITEVTDDWDGDPRPIGAGFDIGADERRPGQTGIFVQRRPNSLTPSILVGVLADFRRVLALLSRISPAV